MKGKSPLHPRRSVLFVPAVNARALAKVATLDVDAVILDLEDSVAPDLKVEARAAVVAALAGDVLPSRAERIVRINALDGPWGTADLEALRAAPPAAVLVPKIASAEEAALAGVRVARLGGATALWLMMEMPGAVLEAHAIARTARDGPLAAFVVGLNDLAKETGTRLAPGRSAFLPSLSLILLAARAEGLVALDGVFNAIRDEAGFAAECRQARELGYDGKTLVHPCQIASANAAFAPLPEELAWARKVIAAFAAPEAAGKSVLALEGQMVEQLHLEAARRLIAMAELIAARNISETFPKDNENSRTR